MNKQLTVPQMRDLISAARGESACDLAVRGGYVVNVFTGEIVKADVGIRGSRIALVSESGEITARADIDATGLFLAPGLIDSHMHLESSLLAPAEFARAVLPLGTTAAVLDPHEVANVAGIDGIRELMRACEDLPVDFYFVVPPCVPAGELETSGARLDADDMAELAGHAGVIGIAEVMDFPSVLEGRPEILNKLGSVPGGVADGHAPGLSGRDLQAYCAAQISSDHEATSPWEGFEKLRDGMYVMIREGSAARNLDDLARIADIHTSARCLLATDDLLPTDLEDRGHINYLLARMVRRGVSPVQAIRMAALNAAQRFKLDWVGAIAPGYDADIAAFEDLADFRAAFVIARGNLAAAGGETLAPIHAGHFDHSSSHSVHLPDVTVNDLIIPAADGPARVIRAEDGQILTHQLLLTPVMLAGKVVTDTQRDILKLVVVERHGKTGDVALGLIHGFSLKSGALAGSVAHDSHNVVAVGVGDSDILLAIRHIGETNGGLVAVDGGKVIAEVRLPVYGLMSHGSAHTVAGELRGVEKAACYLGCQMSHPFMTLSFMCLSVIPELKLTDRGLVEPASQRIVSLFARELAAASTG